MKISKATPAAAATRLLTIYLHDHDAASVGGVKLAQRSAASNQGTPFGPSLASLAEAIQQDQTTLQAIMSDLGVGRSVPKAAVARLGAALGRLKLNGHLVTYSPLSRVLELEALASGVLAKQHLWRSLLGLSANDRRISTTQLEALVARADDQLAELRRLHELAARGFESPEVGQPVGGD